MEFSSDTQESNFSLELFDFLCKVIGSEKDVRSRRIFFKVLDHALQYSPKWRVVTSGSKSEGLDLPGSDLDIMYVNYVDTVYNTQSEIPSGLPYGLFLDLENTPPGYVNIKLNLNNRNGKQATHIYSEKHIISNEHYKQLIQQMNIKNTSGDMLRIYSELHGPCSSTIRGSYDFLSTYKCQSWPIIAAEWITRSRNCQWPPTELIEDIVRDNVLLAPIGSKFYNKNENPYEWRMSFSVAEKMLVDSFNHTQILCYAILKITLKEVIQRHMKGIICSYFLKTLLFWMIEESQVSEWQPCRLFELFQACIKRLTFFVENNVLPNYFIPQNNLIEGKIDIKKKKVLISVLQTFMTKGKKSLRQIQSLKSFFDHSEEHLSRENYSNLDSTLYPLLHYMYGIGFGSASTIVQPIYCMLSHRKCKLLKHLCFIWLTKLCGNLAKHSSIILRLGSFKNKKVYTTYKKCLWYTILGTFSDSYTGWHSLAELFYKLKQIKETLHIIQLCQLKSSADHQIITPDLKPNPQRKILEKIGMTFLQRYKVSCSDLFYLASKDNPHLMFYHEDIRFPWAWCDTFGDNTMVIVNPQIRMYYLLFLCHHYLGNTIEKREALRLLNDFSLKCTNSEEYVDSINHLGLAVNIANTIPSFLVKHVFQSVSKFPMLKDFVRKQFKPLTRATKNFARENLPPLIQKTQHQYERNSMPSVLKKGLRFASDFLNI